MWVGSGHFVGFKILNFNIFRGFQKNEYFCGYEDFVDIFFIFFFFFFGGGGGRDILVLLITTVLTV